MQVQLPAIFLRSVAFPGRVTGVFLLIRLEGLQYSFFPPCPQGFPKSIIRLYIVVIYKVVTCLLFYPSTFL